MWKLLMFGSSIVARMRTCSDLLVLTPRFWTVLGKLAFSLKVFFVINLCIVYSKVSPLGAAFYPLLCAALTLSFAAVLKKNVLLSLLINKDCSIITTPSYGTKWYFTKYSPAPVLL